MSKNLLIALVSVEAVVDGKASLLSAGTPFVYEGDIPALKAMGAAREATEAEVALFEKTNAAKPKKVKKSDDSDAADEAAKKAAADEAAKNKREKEDI